MRLPPEAPAHERLGVFIVFTLLLFAGFVLLTLVGVAVWLHFAYAIALFVVFLYVRYWRRMPRS